VTLKLAVSRSRLQVTYGTNDNQLLRDQNYLQFDVKFAVVIVNEHLCVLFRTTTGVGPKSSPAEWIGDVGVAVSAGAAVGAAEENVPRADVAEQRVFHGPRRQAACDHVVQQHHSLPATSPRLGETSQAVRCTADRCRPILFIFTGWGKKTDREKNRRWTSTPQSRRGRLCHLDDLLCPWPLTSRI